MTKESAKTWAQLVSKDQPLTVAIPSYGGGWYKAAKTAYLLQGITVIDIPYTLKASHFELPENTDMSKVDWAKITPEQLEAAKSTLLHQTNELMKSADMVYLPGWSDSYISDEKVGRQVYDYSASDKSKVHDPKDRTPPPQFQFRYEIEVRMMQIAKENHLPTWGVCAAPMKIIVQSGGTLHPYIDAHKDSNDEIHKITSDEGVGYGDMQPARLKLYTETALTNNLLYPYFMQEEGHALQKLQEAMRTEDPIRKFAEAKVEQGFEQYKGFLALNPIEAQPLNAFHRMHTVMVEPESTLGIIYKLAHPDMDLSKPVAVNSSHYEGISQVPGNLPIVARSAEGFPEAIEVPTLPFGLFTLYHPETNVDGQIDQNGQYQYRGIAMEIIRAQASYCKALKDGGDRDKAQSFRDWAADKQNQKSMQLNRR